MTAATLTVEEILNGTNLGRTQSVGLMDVIPILDMDGSASDETFCSEQGIELGKPSTLIVRYVGDKVFVGGRAKFL